MSEIEEVLKERYPDLTNCEIWELKNTLIEFYACCSKVALKSLQNRSTSIPVNSSSYR